jgi:two-component sensor histidine kinase/ligand-binding sensor domain-containing protein
MNAKKKLSALCGFAVSVFSAIQYRILVVYFLLHCVFHADAQQYYFKNYTIADGLGSSSINHIFQDSKGYIWFATQGGGISRFNGKTFHTYTKADGLISNDITFIAEDKAGNIWIGTAAGASRFNGTTFKNYDNKNGFTGSTVFNIYIAADNRIWFATRDKGVLIYNQTGFDSLTVKNRLPANEVYTIAYDGKDSYWFGTANGIAKYSNGKITDYSKHDLVNEKAFFSSAVDNNNIVLMGATSGEVLAIENNNFKTIALPEPFNHDFVGSIAQCKTGNIWFASDHGLIKYNGNSFTAFTEQNGFSSSIAQTVMCDYEGDIWIGTLGSGAYLLKNESWLHYTDKEGLTGKNVTAIQPADDNGAYFVGTNDGVFVFIPDSNTLFKKINGIKAIDHISVTTLSVDKNGKLWIGSQDAVYVLEKSGRQFQLVNEYKHINSNVIISPTKIIHDKNGNTWIATYGSGIFCFSADNKTIKTYNIQSGLASNNIITAHEDSRQHIWFATQDAGLIKYDGEKFIPFRQLPDNIGAAWSIAEDHDGNIYFGSGESGLYRYNGDTVINYSANINGLSSDYITTLKWDKTQNILWAGSEKGLDEIHFNKDGSINKLKSYREHHSQNQDAICISGNLLMMGTINGLWLFITNAEEKTSAAPKIVLSDLRLFYQKTDWSRYSKEKEPSSGLPLYLSLPHNKNHLTFHLQALTTQNALYTFILEGYDESWSEPISNNEITYNNISPGDYTFRAKAINAGGTESENTVSFSFTVNPPWWSTWWFRTMLLITITGGIMMFIKTREKVLKEQNVKLEKTVKERTEEIEQQKATVEKMLSEKEILLKEIHHRVKNNLQTISSMLMLQSAGLKDEQAKKAITESQSRVRSIALVHQKLYQNDGLEKVEISAFINDLCSQVISFYPHQAEKVKINCRIPEMLILIDTAIPLGLILNELLTNSYKYAFDNLPEGKIEIELDKADNDVANDSKMTKVKLRYYDNGPGFKSDWQQGKTGKSVVKTDWC